jgi:dephospho-CoA kinase
LAREAVEPGSPGLHAIAGRWPQTIAADGTLDRSALAAIVFADDAARAELNAIVHPLVRELALARECDANGRLVIREAPLLFEAGFYRECDANVLVAAPPEVRIARVERRSGLARAEIERRIAAQIAPEAARLLADFTIDNDGDLERLRLRTEQVYRELESRRPRRNSGRSPE